MAAKLPRVGVIGVGFVGTAVSTGFEAVGVEVREYDRYKDTESLPSVVNNSDILFICVPTPVDEEGYCDTSIVENVAKSICSVAETRKVCIIKSTIPPGTTEEIASCYGDHAWVFNPEFLTEKNFINDFMEQDRIILGTTPGVTTMDIEKISTLYEKFTAHQKEPGLIDFTKATEAEIIKYAGNCFLATKVMYFNEIAELCQAMNVNYEEVREMVGLDKRIGLSHTKVPGPDGLKGFGGKCFPKDIQALISLMEDYDLDPIVLTSVWTKNLVTREKEDWKEIKGATTECSYDET